MTIQELEQLRILPKMIEMEKMRLKKLRDAAGIKSPSLTGMPRASGVHDRIGENIPEAVDLEAEIMEQLEELQSMKNRIETWIRQQPLIIQMICELRFIDGCTWNQVADEVYGFSENPGTQDAVRKRLARHLERQ